MPYSRTRPPSWAPNAVPSPRGWESPEGELLIAMKNSSPVSRMGVGGVVNSRLLGLHWVRNGNCGLVLKFNDYVNVVAGAYIQLAGTGPSGNLVLYAAAQTNTNTVVFDRKSDMTMAKVPNHAARYTLIPQSIVGTITDADGDGNTNKVVSVAMATRAGRREVA